MENPMTVKTSISLTDEQQAFARQLVRSGRFASLSAVLQHGLEMVRRETELHDAEREALRQLLADRRTGPFVDVDEGRARTRAMLAAKRAGLEDL